MNVLPSQGHPKPPLLLTSCKHAHLVYKDVSNPLHCFFITASKQPSSTSSNSQKLDKHPTDRSSLSRPFKPSNQLNHKPRASYPRSNEQTYLNPQTPHTRPPNHKMPGTSTGRCAHTVGWTTITVATAKCDACDKREKSTMLRCKTCSWQLCGSCRTAKSVIAVVVETK